MNFDLTARRRTSFDSDRSDKSERSERSAKSAGRDTKDKTPKVVVREPSRDASKDASKDAPKDTPKDAKTPREPAKEKTPAPTMSVDDIRERLTGYMPVPKRHWGDLNRGDQVRWIDLKGEFCKGGFVKFYYDKDDKRMLCAESVLAGSRSDKYYTVHQVELDNIQAMYRKPTVDYFMAKAQFMNELNKLRAEIKTLRGGSASTSRHPN